MAGEEENVNDLGDKAPHIARDPARVRHDEGSASYIKPIIKELVRTQVCFPNIRLLVDKIFIVKVPSATESDPLEAYRMYLTDREKTIQAVVKRRLHKWFTTLDVREGSYLVLKEYDLAKGKRLHGEGDVFYLAISDFYLIGEEQRDNADTDLEYLSSSADGGVLNPLEHVSAKSGNEDSGVDIIRAERSLLGEGSVKTYDANVSSKDLGSSQLTMMDSKKRKRRTSSLAHVVDLASPYSRTNKPLETISAKISRRQGHDNTEPRSPDDKFSSAARSNIPVQQENSMQARISPEQFPSPLQLSTLASITGTNATRNKQVNILAMIDYVSSSTVKPTTAPLKRDVRLVDPSTDKKVTLSVFIDPVNFTPKEYDIILFRELTTHDFSGGNLNAYPKKCRGKEWYILNPYGIKECDMESMEAFRVEYRKPKARGTKQQAIKNSGLGPP